ncbi:dimethylaniline monooxygenase [N-oxide-forming] 5-like protein [Leptotrombidium deliense]|uniref:Flavin-containing monooxygenase n=1 Tax=Leptotrombidium deliense TaxID=299467 RepID=A0A443SI51_9ACAR|nr:dimethylaniline monooxygenase [N-oxide-forming] 5-like protein [Leptotrombidium deliense]
MKKEICVIGAGASGLTSIKHCLEEDLKVICYERTENLGGLWRYRDEVIEGVPCIQKSTVLNTSKELSSFSDFPPAKHSPNFMHNVSMLRYLESYAVHFELKKYIRFGHEVISVTYNDDYEFTGKWKVTSVDKLNQKTDERVFDAVLVCSGHHVKPLIPTFYGQEKFKGKIIHSHSYRTAHSFEDKNVVVVGIGASGADIAVEASRIAKQVYVSSRSGAWVMSRVSRNGIPADASLTTRFINLILSKIPPKISNYLFEKFLNSYFDHRLYGLNPKHEPLSALFTINDCLANCIICGAIKMLRNITEFTENGVIFEGMDKEVKCDVVVLATGYEIQFPFLGSSVISIVDNKLKMYKNVFLPHLKHPKTLAFIGLVQPTSGVFPICEMQSRWFASLMNNLIKLPSREEMMLSIKDDTSFRELVFYNSPRNTIIVFYIQYLDEIASFIGVKPNLWKYCFTDTKLWYALVFGPSLPYQYRLNGPHQIEIARDLIFSYNQRFRAPLNNQ